MKPTRYIIIVLAILCAVLEFQNMRMEHERSTWHADTIYRAYADTLRSTRIDTFLRVYYCPIPVYRKQTDTLWLIRHDTITQRIDTIVMPREQVCYTDDSTYTAYISGYRPELDSIITYRYDWIQEQRVIIQQEALIRKLEKQKQHWHIGPAATVGVTPHGLDYMVGVGVVWSGWRK